MAVLLLWVLITAFIGGSDATWCVCRSDVSPTALQKTLDYACGAGADCGPIIQNGACYQPNTVLSHCSYAANSFFQKKGQAAGTCDFAATATPTATDPSYSGCTFPATPSAAGTVPGTPTTVPGTPTTVPGTPTTVPGTPTTVPGTPTTGTPTTTAPGTTPTMGPPATGTPTTTFAPPGGSTGVLGGLGPSGSGGTISTDGSGAGRHPRAGRFSSARMALVLSCAVLLWAWR